jgi:hypothetical protein
MKRRARSEGEISLVGWRVEFLQDLSKLDLQPAAVAADAIAAAEGKAGHLQHRSRHAVTYLLPVRTGAGEMDIYVKVYRPPGGLNWFKSRWRGGRADNAIRMSTALRREGFAAPALLLAGRHSATRRTMLVAMRAQGVALPELLRSGPNAASGWLERKRTILRELGVMVARLHAKGYVHGDLTPYNVFVVTGERPAFVLLDHDRTRMAFPLGRQRRQLRNLVQLGRFSFASITESDRLRVFRSYAARLDRRRYRSMLRRTARMLASRRRNGR